LRLLGLGKSDGIALFLKLANHLISLYKELQSFGDQVEMIARRHEEIAKVLTLTVLAQTLPAFIDSSLKSGKLARKAMADLSKDSVDLRKFHEVEYLVFMTTLNGLLLSETLGQYVRGKWERESAVISLLRDENDPYHKIMLDIISSGEIAELVLRDRAVNSPTYESNFLEETIRPLIPGPIVSSGKTAFSRVRQKIRQT